MVELTRLARNYNGASDCTVTLGYSDRHRRRILLTLDDGSEALLNLPTAERFDEGDALIGDRIVLVKAAIEDVLVITGDNLVELAWHIGNRHLPAQMGRDEEEIVIAYDHVIAHMLIGLGAQVQREGRAFSPVAGAYHSHDH